MTSQIEIAAPAKINIFLKVLNKRLDGYHNIRSGITFVNLFDKVVIKKSDKMTIRYDGPFKPDKENYDDCIILKTLNFLKINDKIKLDISITKNIPVAGGLGSASTNAAALIKGLNEMNLIKKKENKEYVSLGADIPCFLYKQNCLAMGIGEILYPLHFPKYYFLIIQPKWKNSTKEMYNKLESYDQIIKDSSSIPVININDDDFGNDFEKVVLKEQKNFREIMSFIEQLNNVIFCRMTGSGSCFYAVFEKKKFALEANNIFKRKFNDLWTYVCENNTF